MRINKYLQHLEQEKTAQIHKRRRAFFEEKSRLKTQINMYQYWIMQGKEQLRPQLRQLKRELKTLLKTPPKPVIEGDLTYFEKDAIIKAESEAGAGCSFEDYLNMITRKYLS